MAQIARAGADLSQARAAVILVHGRGATAGSILALAREIQPPGEEPIAYLAPQAPGNTWYPYSFLAPVEQNQPHLTRALDTLADVLVQIEEAGIPLERVGLAGFSQGACLALEFAARSGGRSSVRGGRQVFGAVAGLSGGLVGPPGAPLDYPGRLDGTPVFLGCSDVDPHIPKQRVLETARVFEIMGASVTTRIYPGMDHTINADEIAFLRQMLHALAGNPPTGW